MCRSLASGWEASTPVHARLETDKFSIHEFTSCETPLDTEVAAFAGFPFAWAFFFSFLRFAASDGILEDLCLVMKNLEMLYQMFSESLSM